MADFDSQLPVRAIATQFTTEVANSTGTTIDPATEGTLVTANGHLTSIDTDIDVALSTRASEVTLSAINGKLNSLGQKTMANSVPVVIASDQSAIPVSFTPSTRANRISYNTSAALAAGASNTHTFTPGVNFILHDVYASSSGQMKIEIQTGTTGAETTKVVLFTSKGNLIARWQLTDELAVPTTDSVKVIRTNLDNQAMDVYSSIQGVDA